MFPERNVKTLNNYLKTIVIKPLGGGRSDLRCDQSSSHAPHTLFVGGALWERVRRQCSQPPRTKYPTLSGRGLSNVQGAASIEQVTRLSADFRLK